ncbi:flagellar hook-basal body complex protein FliE [Sphingomonas adhaesiva]|uniref:flagellar hook-basal body complex protein FliE n=1 Tax=Sphingomonas adhaesiva TaxID=28212 RepID=UPI002FFBA2D3
MAVIVPVAPVAPAPGPAVQVASASAPAQGFGALLSSGLAAVDARVARADALVAAVARGETVPMHDVALALEQARLSVEIAAEVRTRMLDAYRDFMTMQV